MASEDRRVVILGAGLGGLSAGWALAGAGYEVTILEKDDVAGGLALTRAREGYRYDLGPHNIHTRHLPVLRFLQRHFSGLFAHVLTSRIRKGGTWMEYPLRGAKVITSLPLYRLPWAVASFFAARARMFLTEPAEDGSFACWIRNRFGDVLFREYFRDYPQKVWKIPPEEIDRVVGEARIPILGFVEMLRAALLGRSPRLDHPEVASENYYLPDGIGEIAEFFEREFRARGGAIRFRARVRGVRLEEGRAAAVALEEGGRDTELACDHLLSTVPLPDFVRLFPTASGDVLRAAKEIDYCATVLLFLRVTRRGVLPAHFIYFTESDVPFSRVSDMAMFSERLVPPGRGLLCLEYPCAVGDAIWNCDPAALAEAATGILVEKGLLRAGEVEGWFLEKVSHSYPRFRKGFRDHVEVCRNFLGGHPNVLSYGRQGGFSYINSDGVIRQGFLAAASVSSAGPTGFGLSEWFASAL